MSAVLTPSSHPHKLAHAFAYLDPRRTRGAGDGRRPSLPSHGSHGRTARGKGEERILLRYGIMSDGGRWADWKLTWLQAPRGFHRLAANHAHGSSRWNRSAMQIVTGRVVALARTVTFSRCTVDEPVRRAPHLPLHRLPFHPLPAPSLRSARIRFQCQRPRVHAVSSPAPATPASLALGLRLGAESVPRPRCW